MEKPGWRSFRVAAGSLVALAEMPQPDAAVGGAGGERPALRDPALGRRGRERRDPPDGGGVREKPPNGEGVGNRRAAVDRRARVPQKHASVRVRDGEHGAARVERARDGVGEGDAGRGLGRRRRGSPATGQTAFAAPRLGSIGSGKCAPVRERPPFEDAHDAVARGHGDVGAADGHGPTPTDPRVDPTLHAFAPPKHAQDTLLGQGVQRVAVAKNLRRIRHRGVAFKPRSRFQTGEVVGLASLLPVGARARRAHGDPRVRRVTPDVDVLGPALDQPEDSLVRAAARQLAILGVKRTRLVVRTSRRHGPHLEVSYSRGHESGAGRVERYGAKVAGGVVGAKVSRQARPLAPVPERDVPVVVRSQRQHPGVVARAERDGDDAVPVPSENGERAAGVGAPDDGGGLMAALASRDEGSGDCFVTFAHAGECDAREWLAAVVARAR
mmetsp:Transcript_10513/g.43549  ORF Transcript_10513/g.43549 Transcript_10513/m.43549 type:complete len:441 (-) Transcript_10513:495-1817(-)